MMGGFRVEEVTDMAGRGASAFDIECPECGRDLTVTADLLGTSVRCPHCEAGIALPGADEVDPWIEEPPEEPVVAAAAPPSRSRPPADRGSRGPDRGTAARKKGTRTLKKGPPRRSPKTGLLVVGAVAALAAVAVAVALLARPAKSPGLRGGAGGETAGPPTDGEPPGAGANAVEDFRARAGLARSASDHLALAQEAEALALAADAGKHYRKVLELDPENETARTSLGWKRYALPEGAAELPASFFEDLRAEVGRWVSPEDMDALRAREEEALAKARAELDKRAKDPFYANVAGILATLENVKGFKDYLFHTERSDPYLLIEHVGRKGFNPYRSDEAKRLAAQKVEGLKHVHRTVVETFMEPAGLARDENRPMGVVSLEDRGVFEEFQKAIGQVLPPGAAAYFNPLTKFVVMNNAPGATEGLEETTTSILIHEATHQIVDAYCNPGGGMAVRVSLWANEGIAEYTASMRLKPKPDGTVEYLLAYEMSSHRLAEFYAARFPKKFRERTALGLSSAYALSLEELVQIRDMGQCHQRVLAKWMAAGGKNPMSSGGAMGNRILAIVGSLIYAEATSFFFFCLQGEPETYRDKLMAYLQREFRGTAQVRGAKTFREIFGDDLAALETKWLAYVDSKTTLDIKEGHMD